MGVLTETMMRLRDEIVSSRHVRLSFQRELLRQAEERRNQVSDLCAAFARDRAGAHCAWFGPKLSDRRTASGQRQQPPATPKAEPHRHAKAAPEPAAGPPVAPLRRAKKRPFKGSRKH